MFLKKGRNGLFEDKKGNEHREIWRKMERKGGKWGQIPIKNKKNKSSFCPTIVSFGLL